MGNTGHISGKNVGLWFKKAALKRRFVVSIVFLVALGILGIDVSLSQVPPSTTSVRSLFEFESVDEGRWDVVNDGVMGGRSQGFVEIQDGKLRFTGNVVTRGGGFTSLRTSKSVDISGFDGLEITVRGGGRTFEIEVSDGAMFRRRSVSRRAPFETSADWNTVRVPFSSFRATIFGRPVDMPPIDLTKIERLGIFIADAIDGAFELEVDAIRVYRDQ